MKLKVKELLKYFDTKESSNYGDTTAVISVVGEDLGATLFKHFCENERNSDVEIIDPNEEIPTEGKKIGRRLDRWIFEKTQNGQVLYQTEIKSWCSRAIGGITIPVDINEKELSKKAKQNWDKDIQEINDTKVNNINKVLVEMPTDKKIERLGVKHPYEKKPLLIFWDARSPSGGVDYFSQYITENKSHHFDYCLVFSCSLYLRYLYRKGVEEISIEIPNAERRLKALNRLFILKS